MAEETTTIKLTKKTKERMDNLKEYKSETYEEIIVKLIELLNLLKASPQQAISRLGLMEQQRKRLVGG